LLIQKNPVKSGKEVFFPKKGYLVVNGVPYVSDSEHQKYPKGAMTESAMQFYAKGFSSP